MENFTKLQSWVATFVGILSLCGILALWDCYQSAADNRGITSFTTWVLVAVVVEHIAMLVGAFLLYHHAPELTALRRASVENIGLTTKVMFLTQDNERMLGIIRSMEGLAAPVTNARRRTRRTDSPQQSQQGAAVDI